VGRNRGGAPREQSAAARGRCVKRCGFRRAAFGSCTTNGPTGPLFEGEGQSLAEV
jgi:hypothetical protein